MGLQGPGSLLVAGSSFPLLHISYLLWELGGLPPGMGYCRLLGYRGNGLLGHALTGLLVINWLVGYYWLVG